MSESKPLQGQVALVTGGSRGIGAATVVALAEAGADVMVAYASNHEAAKKIANDAQNLGVRSQIIAADLGDGEAAAALVPKTLETFERLDIVVNNAGITRDNLALRMNSDDWSAVLRTNLDAAFLISKAALKPMLKQKSGRIINVSSIAGITGNPGQANYSAAKAGLIGLTKSLAKEVGSRGITINAVAPGFIDTEMANALGQEMLTEAAKLIPLGRLGKAPEVAAAIRFLCLPEASYITGAVLQVDGGLAA